MQVGKRLAGRTPFYYGWVILFAAGSSQFARNAAASLTLAVFMYPIAQELGWSRTLIAGAAGAGGLAASGASPIVGWLSDRYGVRLVLSASILILGISTLSLAWATVPIAFYLAYGTGRVIFSSPIQIGASVVVSRWFVRLRGRATGLLGLSHSAGMVLFPLIAGLVIQTRGYQTAWIVLGVIVLAVALGPVTLLIIQRPEDVGLRPDGDEEDGQDCDQGGDASAATEEAWTLKEAMRTPALWMLAFVTGILFLLQAGINIHQAAFFRDQGLGAAIAATSVSLNAVFVGLGSVAWGWLLDKVSARTALAGVAIMMSVTSGLFATADSTLEALAYASLFGFSLGGLLTVPPVAFANFFGRSSLGSIRGVTEPFTSLGQAIGAVLSGVIFDLTGSYNIAFLSYAVLGIMTLVLVLAVRPPRRPNRVESVSNA